MVLRSATSLRGALEGVGPENRDFWAQKSQASWDPANDDINLVWFGKMERKVAKFLMTTFACCSSSQLFYGLGYI
jgi:hypothetical protein